MCGRKALKKAFPFVTAVLIFHLQMRTFHIIVNLCYAVWKLSLHVASRFLNGILSVLECILNTVLCSLLLKITYFADLFYHIHLFNCCAIITE